MIKTSKETRTKKEQITKEKSRKHILKLKKKKKNKNPGNP